MHSEAKLDGRVEAERLTVLSRSLSIVLGTPMTQPGLVETVGDRQRAVAADRDERVDVAGGEQLDELVGAIDLDVGAVGLAHREGRRVAPVGGAEDRAAEVDDAAHARAAAARPAVAVALREHQPVEAVADADDVPAAAARRARRRGSRR